MNITFDFAKIFFLHFVDFPLIINLQIHFRYCKKIWKKKFMTTLKKSILMLVFSILTYSLFAGAGKEPISNAFFNGKIDNAIISDNLIQDSTENELYTYFDYGLIEKNIINSNTKTSRQKELYYQPSSNEKIKSANKQKILINLSNSPQSYDFCDSKVIVKCLYETLVIQFDLETGNLIQINKTSLQNSQNEIWKFKYNSENLLDSIEILSENYSSTKLKCYYDGIPREIPKPYCVEVENQNIYYLRTEEINVFSEENKLIPQWKTFITLESGDRKEPENLEDEEKHRIQRIYRFDNYGNLTRIYENLSDNWIYNVVNVLDENKNWISQRIFLKQQDNSTKLFYSYSREINYY